MQITIHLSEEQQKALLTEYTSIEWYVQQVVANRANKIMDQIVCDYAGGKINADVLTETEQALMDTSVAGKIIVRSDHLPREVKAMIVKKANTTTMAEKVAAQILIEKPLAK